MKIAYNPLSSPALSAAPTGNDITFDLPGISIYSRGVRFKGTDTTYNVFKKHTSSGSGGYNGLVPVPSFTTTLIRYLREDGTWQVPIPQATSYTLLINGDFNTLTAEGRWYFISGSSTTTNGPSNVNNGAELYVGRNAGGYRYLKVITASGIVWFRYWDSSAWKPWVRWYTDANTDKNVLLSVSTTTDFRPLIIGFTNSSDPAALTTTITNLVYVANAIYAQPSTASLFARTFVGALKGNADTSTSLGNVNVGNLALPIYFAAGKPVACTASSLFSNLTNSGNNISVTVAGLNRLLTVSYASRADRSNILQCVDIRNITTTPGNKLDTSVTSWFNQTDTPGTGWWGGITVKGWTDVYEAWEIAGPATNTNSKRGLFFRSGSGPTWNAWERILTSANTYLNTSTGVITINNVSATLSLGLHTHNYAGSLTPGGAANSLLKFTVGDSSGPVNCNNIKSNAIVYYTSGGPTGMSTADGGLYAQFYSASWGGQIAQDYRNGELAIRGLNSGTWQPWYKILSSLNSSLTTTADNITIKINNAIATIPTGGSNDGRYLKKVGDTILEGGLLLRAGKSTSYIYGRNGAILRLNSYTGYNPILSLKTTNGDWSQSVYADDTLQFVYCTDVNYNAGTNTPTALIRFRPDGTIMSPFVHLGYNVGIGTSSPAAKLHVSGGNIRLENGNPEFEFWRGSNSSWKLVTNSENFCILNNYTTVAGAYFNVLLLDYNSGAARFRGTIFGNYFNSNITDDNLSDIGSVYVRNTTDNYIRRVSKTLFLNIIASNFVTLNTAQIITGVKTFTTLLKFNVANGTSPFTVVSNTLVNNLNADLWRGLPFERLYIPAGALLGISGTVATKKVELVNYFNNYGTGVGANATVSTSLIQNWNTDSTALYDSSVYSMIKIGGGYSNTTYGQWLLSSYNLTSIGVVGRTGSVWSGIKWLAYTTDNVSSATKLQTARNINGTSFDGTADITTNRWGYARTLSLTGSITGSATIDGSGNISLATTYQGGNIGNLDSRYVNITGDTMVGYLNINTSGVYVKFGCQNGSYAHYETNASSGHYFNKSIDVNGQIRVYNTGTYMNATGFYKNGSSDLYVLLGGGSHKLISDFATSSHVHNFDLILDINPGVLAIGAFKRRSIVGAGTTGLGYLTRIALGVESITNNFNNGLISVGTNDAGTTWTDFRFRPNGDFIIDGLLYSTGVLKAGSSNAYVLLGGGSHNVLSSDPVGSSLVLRTSDGYIKATYFNSAIGDENSSPIGSVYVRNTTDNYIRRVSHATFINSIGPSLDSRYVTIATALNIVGQKTFSIGTFRLSNSESNTVSDFSKQGVTGLGAASISAIERGFDFTHYSTHWKIGNVRGSAADTIGFGFANEANVLVARITNNGIIAPSFIKYGGTVSQLLRADGGVATFNWSGQGGQPTWLWGGTTLHTYQVYNPSNFSVSSLKRIDTVDPNDSMTNDTSLAVRHWTSWLNTDNTNKIGGGGYNVGISVGGVDTTKYGFQLGVDSKARTDTLWYKGWTMGSSSIWRRILHDGNYNNYSPTLTGGGASGTWNINITGTSTTSIYVSSGFSSTKVNTWNCNTPDRVVYSDYGSSGRSIANAPSGWQYGTLLHLGHSNYSGTVGSLNLQLMWDVAHGTSNGGTLWFRGKDTPNGWNKNWCKIITDLNYTPVLDSRYALKTSINLQVGGTKSALMSWGSWNSVDSYGGAIQILEFGHVGTTQSAWLYAPRLSFHWGSRYARGFGMRSDGLFAVDDVPISLNTHNHNSSYVTSLGTSGNYLTWTRNGVVNNINVPNADRLDGVHLLDLYIPTTIFNNITGTVAAKKAELVTYFNKYTTGIGANATVSESVISRWNYDTASLYDSSVYTMIKIGGGYPGTTHGQWLLSSFNLSPVGIVGRVNNVWSEIKWLAFTTDIKDPINYYWANVKVSTSSSTATTPTFSSAYASNWFRSTGLTGWINSTYGGGIYQTDSTYVRVYGSKLFYVGSTSTDAISTAGGCNIAGRGHFGGHVDSAGFHHNSVNSDNYVLLAGGGYKVITGVVPGLIISLYTTTSVLDLFTSFINGARGKSVANINVAGVMYTVDLSKFELLMFSLEAAIGIKNNLSGNFAYFGGSNFHTISQSEMPAHRHYMGTRVEQWGDNAKYRNFVDFLGMSAADTDYNNDPGRFFTRYAGAGINDYVNTSTVGTLGRTKLTNSTMDMRLETYYAITMIYKP